MSTCLVLHEKFSPLQRQV